METQTLVKCGTTIALATATIGSVVGAVAVAAVAAKVSLAALAVLGLAATWGSVTAGLSSNSLDEYFSKLPTHTSVALSGIFVGVSTALFQAVVNAFAQALGDKVYTSLTGRETKRVSVACY